MTTTDTRADEPVGERAHEQPAELMGPLAVRFLRGLPKRAAAEVWAIPAGKELLLSEGPARGGVHLNFEPTLELGLLADRSGLAPERVRAALTQLGPAGRVGYDLFEAAHFHRELPYDRDHVAELNPRLTSARALVEQSAVRLIGLDSAEVTTNGGVRLVRLEAGSCTCPWWYDHRGSRGPCKHVLAARILAREVSGSKVSSTSQPAQAQIG